MKNFYVIGSLNMDITAYVPHFPKAGETLIGYKSNTLPGGKGGNQAVALARLSSHVKPIENKVVMFGKIGDDTLGEKYKDILLKEHIDISHIEIESDTASGIALIEVEQHSAQNRIIVIPGANEKVDSRYITKSCQYILEEANKNPTHSHIVLLQLEIPISSTLESLAILSQNDNITTILDPAPVPNEVHKKISSDFYTHIDYITPNETETFYLTGIEVKDEASAKKAGNVLLSYSCKKVIIKAGKNGAYFISKDEFYFIPQVSGIQAVDTTAAGDSFNAGLAYALSEHMPIQKAMLFANKVAGLSTTKEGAQSAMPTLSQLQSFHS